MYSPSFNCVRSSTPFASHTIFKQNIIIFQSFFSRKILSSFQVIVILFKFGILSSFLANNNPNALNIARLDLRGYENTHAMRISSTVGEIERSSAKGDLRLKAIRLRILSEWSVFISY